ncbi:hypothetical protein MASR2M12_18850 [Bacteroidales bacterium]
MKDLNILFLFVLLLHSCAGTGTKPDYDVDPNNREIIAEEVLQTSSYTYIHANEKGRQYWIAVTSTPAEKGKTYYFSQWMEMTDFHSKELDRDFDQILFVGDLATFPVPAKSAITTQPVPQQAKTPNTKQDVHIEAVEGGVRLQELFGDPDKFSGKKVKITGQVTKFNSGIMGKNWVHIQDGTSLGEFFDLTITTDEMLSVGDVAVFEGIITLNKDLGSGYFFSVLMEDARVSSQKVF